MHSVGELSKTPLQLKGISDWTLYYWNPAFPYAGKYLSNIEWLFWTVIDESPRQGRAKLNVQQSYEDDVAISDNPSPSSICKQSNLGALLQSNLEDIKILGKFPSATTPRYLNLEPFLAMDWLEISWEELHIKERVGAGTFSALINYTKFWENSAGVL